MRKASFLSVNATRFLFALPWSGRLVLIAIGLMLAPDARSQAYNAGDPVDITGLAGNEVNPSITIDPLNPANIFAVSVSERNGLVNPLATSISSNQGKKWATNYIATGTDDLLPAYGYPSAAFDSYGNLYVAYVPNTFEGV